MTLWTDTVKKTFKQGRLTNPAYQFKNALKDAKKYYKKGKTVTVDAVKKTGKHARKCKHARKLKKNVTSRVRKSMRGKKSGGTSKKQRRVTSKNRSR